MNLLATFFGTAPSSVASLDRVASIDAEVARLRSERDQLSDRVNENAQAAATLDETRRALAYKARVDHDAEAAQLLTGCAQQARQLDDDLRDTKTALLALDDRLATLAAERLDAELAVHETASVALADQQRRVGADLDAALRNVANILRRFVDLDLELSKHAIQLHATQGRAILHRVSDALSFSIWAASLPPSLAASAVELRLNATSAHRHLTFEAAARLPARRGRPQTVAASTEEPGHVQS